MAFPASPTNGQIYKKYTYNGSTWDLTVPTTISGEYSLPTAVTIGGDQVYRQAFYRYSNGNQALYQYIHMKTNIPVNSGYSVMFGVHFLGYSYGEIKTIDAMLGFYCYSGTANIVNTCTSGTHACSAYKSADGYAVITIYVTSIYYLGFVCDQICANPTGMPTLAAVTASTNSAAATGLY